MHALCADIKHQGRRLGFDLVGIAPAQPTRHRDYLRQWLDDGQAGTMQYLHNRFEERTDPAVYFPGAQSIICVAMNYHVQLAPSAEDESPRGKIARYALGEDYHELMKKRLHQLADWLREKHPDAKTRAAVDTAPVMEKELASRAGIGWVGKHTCVINPRIGSWILLGEILTTLPLPPDQPGVDRCGTCRRCIDACPTGAITAPYQLDARRCISYLTIERREEIPSEFQKPLGPWLFGCDICQEVCPWNNKAPIPDDPAVTPRFPTGTINLEQLLSWKDEDYRQNLRRSAMKRVKLPILQRNAALVRQNIMGYTGSV
jgi:epoxyqueuosine reductase